MKIKDDELSILIEQKKHLVRRHDREDTDRVIAEAELNELEDKIDKRRELILADIKQKENERMGENQMVEQEEVKIEKPKIGRKVREESYATAIAKALSMKTIKNVDEAAAKVLEIKPGRDKDKVVSQIKAIIREVTKEKGRWKAYNWDKDNFLLTEK